MNKLRIAVIPGDGTGPEVTTEALKVLQAVAALEKFQYELEQFDYGGQRYLRTGEVLPDGERGELVFTCLTKRASRSSASGPATSPT